MPDSSTGLRSGQVAAAAGVNVQTLRYYERRGLLARPGRTLGGHRVYPLQTVTLLRIIKAAQRLGFTLDEVADLIEPAGRRRHRGPDAGLHARAQAKLVDIEQKIADLVVIRDTLREAVAAGCDDLVACAHSSCCPLPFEALGEGGERAGSVSCRPAPVASTPVASPS
jgi:DNA-binding transcriptional MerR regulator